MRWLHRGLPGVGIPADITAEGALADLHAAGGHVMVNLLFPLRGRRGRGAAPLRRGAVAQDPGVIPVGGVHVDDAGPGGRGAAAIEEHGMRGLKLHPMVQRFSPGHPALEPAIAALAEYALPLYVHTGFDEWYGWGYDLGELERIAERHPSIPLVLCHCAFPRLEWATEMARRHPQVWLDTTNVFGSIALAPAGEARERLERELRGGVRDRARPHLLRHRLSGCDGHAGGAARAGRAVGSRRSAVGGPGRERRAIRARDASSSGPGLDLERALSRMVRA